MNKVFKVIWSEARNAYVVVSEMAKSHGTKSCSTKKLLAMLIATGVMTCASVAPAMAANLAPTDTKIEIGSGAAAKGSEGVAIGKNSEASASGYATAIGGDAKATGSKSTVVGNYSKATEAGTISIGYGNLSSGANAITIGHEAIAAGMNSFAFGSKANASGESSVAFGNGSKATHLIAIAIGSGAAATDKETIAIGGSAKATSLYSVAIGNHIDKTGEKAVAIGQQTRAYGKHSTAVGAESQAQYKGATAVGTFSKAIKEGSIALGYNSYADREAGVKGYDPLTGKESTLTSLAWKSGKGALSIGSAGGARQIINVAAGSEDTDAVNVAQLKKVGELAEKGWQLSANGGKATKVAPGAKVDFSGDDENIIVSKEGTSVQVKLNRNLHVDNVNAGDYFFSAERGIGFGGDAYITQNGLDANDKVITNVAAGVYNTDAVNVGQLKEVEEVAANANKGWNLSTNGAATSAINVAPGEYVDFSGDKNISVSHDGTKVQVELNKDIDVNSVQTNTVQTNALNAKYNLSVGTMAENGIMPFFVNSTGDFYAAHNKFSVDKDGNMNANSVQTNALNSKYNLSVGTMAENGIMPFFVNSTGAFYAAHNKFHVDKDGKVTATAGEIGNVVLNNGVFYKNSALRDG